MRKFIGMLLFIVVGINANIISVTEKRGVVTLKAGYSVCTLRYSNHRLRSSDRANSCEIDGNLVFIGETVMLTKGLITEELLSKRNHSRYTPTRRHSRRERDRLIYPDYRKEPSYPRPRREARVSITIDGVSVSNLDTIDEVVNRFRDRFGRIR